MDHESKSRRSVIAFLTENKLLISLLLGIFGSALLVIYFVNPTETSWLPSCVFHRVTGFHCPGCGSTRALRALVNGEVYAAFRLNPILFTGIPIVAGLAIWQIRLRESNPKLNYIATLAIVTIVLGYYAARNIPSPSTSPLRPIDLRSDAPSQR